MDKLKGKHYTEYRVVLSLSSYTFSTGITHFVRYHTSLLFDIQVYMLPNELTSFVRKLRYLLLISLKKQTYEKQTNCNV